MTYIDRLNCFYRHIVYNDLPPHAQLTYLHLLNVANQLGWQEKFCITDRRLETLTGLSSKAIADAKRILKDRFVTINTNKKKPRQGSCYSLLNLLHSIESKTESKTESKRESKTESKIRSKPDSLPSISMPKIKEREEDGDTAGATADAGARETTLNTEIVNLWRGDIGELGGWVYQKLFDLQQRFGVEKLKYAITEGIEIHGATLGVRYVQRVLENPQERPQKSKGARKIEKSDNVERTERKSSGLQRDYDRAFGFDEDD